MLESLKFAALVRVSTERQGKRGESLRTQEKNIRQAVEYHGGTQKSAFEAIEEKIRENTAEVLEASKTHNQMPREAALSLATQRVAEAMAYRRHT